MIQQYDFPSHQPFMVPNIHVKGSKRVDVDYVIEKLQIMYAQDSHDIAHFVASMLNDLEAYKRGDYDE